jgi:hypothetical protein
MPFPSQCNHCCDANHAQEIASCFLAASSYKPNVIARDALSLNCGANEDAA